MSTWLVNDASPESLGLEVVGGAFRSGRASSVQLARTTNFDASESPFTQGAAVVIKKDGAVFFRGKVRACDKSGSGSNEGQDFLVEDVWVELERLTYQEPWQIRNSDYAGTIYSPTVVLGMNSAGTRISLGAQITEALNFAASQGVSMSIASMPTSMTLWPSGAVGMSCAEVIRDVLKYNPDWVPWIDHSTSPVTFRVTPRASASSMTMAVTSCSDFRIRKTHDRVPAGVKIIYNTASKVDDEVYRSMQVDLYPIPPGLSGGPLLSHLVGPAGPGILVTTVEQAGMQMQIQKQQVQTRTLPTSESGANAYLKKKFPYIAKIDDSKFTITDWDREFVDESVDEFGDPIDEKMPRMAAENLSDMPRELTKGNIAEWMRRKVGKINLSFKLKIESSATEKERKRLERVSTEFTVTGTNAVTKTYKGISSYTPGESAPVGIAQAFYETLVSGCNFEGSATFHGDEFLSNAFHGAVLNLTGGVSEWTTMRAPIHSVSWDISRAETTVDFGPNPDFSVQDFVEFLRLLNKRPNNEYTIAERAGDQLGDDAGISARGDTVGAFDTPETITGGGGGGETFSHPFKLTTSVDAGSPKYKISKGSITDGTNGAAEAIDSLLEVDHTASAGFVVLEGAVSAGEVSGWTVAVVTEADAKEVKMNGASPPVQEKVRLVLGKLTLEGSVATAWQAWFTSARLCTGLLNGSEAILLESAPTHPSKI